MIRSALALVLVLAACPPAGSADPAGGGGGGADAGEGAAGDPRLEFSARQLPQGEQVSQPSASATGGEGTVRVTGRLSAPDPCRNVTGALERSGDALTLRVSVAPGADMCAQVIAAFEYTGVVSGLSPGAYTLRVVHTYPQTGWDTETVLEESVRVR